jgi:hypothetical protein
MDVPFKTRFAQLALIASEAFVSFHEKRVGDREFPFAVVHVVDNPNSHDYPLNVPVLLSHHSHGFYIRNGNTKMGNNLPDIRSFSPVADEAEIVSFIDALDEDILRRHYQHFVDLTDVLDR